MAVKQRQERMELELDGVAESREGVTGGKN